MNLKVLFFAAARDAVGNDSMLVEVPDGGTVADLQRVVISSVPSLERWSQALLWAVNNRYVGRDQVLSTTDIVACFPPVSGG